MKTEVQAGARMKELRAKMAEYERGAIEHASGIVGIIRSIRVDESGMVGSLTGNREHEVDVVLCVEFPNDVLVSIVSPFVMGHASEWSSTTDLLGTLVDAIPTGIVSGEVKFGGLIHLTPMTNEELSQAI